MKTRNTAAQYGDMVGEIVQVLRGIDAKLDHLIDQLREDLYILVPRDRDDIFGGRVRGRRGR